MARVMTAPLALAKVKAFPTLSPVAQLLYCNTAVSMLHSVLSSLLSISTLLTSHSLHSDYINSVTRSEFLTTALSTGYFVYDLWDYVLNRLYIKSSDVVLHHVVVLICYISALTKTVGVPLLSLALVCELHSVLMHARKLLTMSNFSVRQSRFLRWVWLAQWIFFVIARLPLHAVVAVLTYHARSLFAYQLHWAMAFGGIMLINLLNTQLFHNVRKAYQNDYAVSKACNQ
uniref:TLC domain-containing protein n=1 Tax=Hyaloperonospora arabidopsidis (strain Emoy2) TaxID=559515 RepID=M4B1E5_HYAAE